MDIRQLKYFLGVVEAGSFTKAAAQLHVAQSALSLQVRHLEERLGTPLLVRDKDGVHLTHAGAKLREHARIILRQVAAAEAELTSAARAPTGEVAIGIPSGAARVMISQLLAAARREIPQVSLKIVEGMSSSLEERMAAGRFDLTLLYRTVDGVGEYEELAREEFCLIAHPDKPPFGAVVELAELLPLPLTVPMSGNSLRSSLAEASARMGCTLNVSYEVDSLSSIVRMVAEAQTYSILTPAAVHNEVRAGRVKALKIVNPVISRAVVLAMSKHAQSSQAAQATRSVLMNVVRRLVEAGEWPASLPALAAVN